jgi:hypothetical protein
MDLLQTLQEKPVLSISSAFTVLCAVVGATVWLWGEFAHAGDVTKAIESVRQESKQDQAATVREIQINRLSGEIGLIQIQSADTKNRLGDLSAKQKLTPGEAQRAKELADDFADLQATKRSKERLLDQIKAGKVIQ